MEYFHQTCEYSAILMHERSWFASFSSNIEDTSMSVALVPTLEPQRSQLEDGIFSNAWTILRPDWPIVLFLFFPYIKEWSCFGSVFLQRGGLGKSPLYPWCFFSSKKPERVVLGKVGGRLSWQIRARAPREYMSILVGWTPPPYPRIPVSGK